MSDSPIPTVRAMLLCDQIIIDQQSNKKSLIGIFHQMRAFQFPAVHPQMSIYAQLMDASGQYRWKLRMVNLKDERVVNEIVLDGAPIQDPLQPADIVVNMMGVEVPEEGKYEIQLYANDAYLSRITMEAIKVNLPGGQQWQPRQQ